MPERSVVIGCDPGASGALALLVNGSLVSVLDMPTLSIKVGRTNRTILDDMRLSLNVRTWLDEHVGVADRLHIVFEEVTSQPQDGGIQAFAFGLNYGLVRGVMAGLCIPRTMVRPAEWKRALRMKKGKDASRLRASELFPGMSQAFARAKDDGRAEAALIAYWGHTHLP